MKKKKKLINKIILCVHVCGMCFIHFSLPVSLSFPLSLSAYFYLSFHLALIFSLSLPSFSLLSTLLALCMYLSTSINDMS